MQGSNGGSTTKGSSSRMNDGKKPYYTEVGSEEDDGEKEETPRQKPPFPVPLDVKKIAHSQTAESNSYYYCEGVDVTSIRSVAKLCKPVNITTSQIEIALAGLTQVFPSVFGKNLFQAYSLEN
jgi:hypothetical protein